MERLSHELITRALAERPGRAVTWGHSQLGLPLFLPWAFARALLWGARHRVTLCHIGDPVLAPLGLALRSALRCPVVVTVHGLDLTFRPRIYQWALPPLLRRMDGVIAISSAARGQALRRGADPERCAVIPLGISPPASPPPGGRPGARRRVEERWGLPLGERGLLLTVGRLVRRKGVAWFLEEVLPLLKGRGVELLYCVAGEGPERGRCEGLAQRLGGDAARILGRVSDLELEDLYTAADLFVMPNIPVEGDIEGFGIVALEAAVRGCPVVAARLDGIPDAVVPGTTGILVEPGDAEAFADAIGELLSDPPRREALGERARDYVRKECLWQRMVDRYLRTFDALAARGRDRSYRSSSSPSTPARS